MFTYFVWKSFIDEFNITTTKQEKMMTYAFCSFISIIIIIADILFSVFEILGILIYLIRK